MKCKKCGSTNVDFRAENENTGAIVKKVSFLSRLGRFFLICCTLGLWLLVPKKKETQKAKNKVVKLCTCKDCGYVWKE